MVETNMMNVFTKTYLQRPINHSVIIQGDSITLHPHQTRIIHPQFKHT